MAKRTIITYLKVIDTRFCRECCKYPLQNETKSEIYLSIDNKESAADTFRGRTETDTILHFADFCLQWYGKEQ